MSQKQERARCKALIEAALFAVGKPLSISALAQSVLVDQDLSSRAIQSLLDELMQDYQDRGIELKQVASGYRFQTRESFAPQLARLWQEKAPRYSRATLETLTLIAYRQPITRGEIESIRGVSVSHTIINTLKERGWIRVVGHKEVPGRPALYATTKGFLDYFNLEALEQLPKLNPDMLTKLSYFVSGESKGSEIGKTDE